MTFEQALQLLRGSWYPSDPSRWMDLGCGDGFFTRALARQLAEGSWIYAWDQDALALQRIPESIDGIHIDKRVCNFIQEPFPVKPVHGIIMANALHYVPDQVDFLNRLRQTIQPDGVLLTIEYDRIQANPWVPYPVPFSKLMSIARQASWATVQKNGTVPSRYGPEIYAAILQ
ncbi:MAG: class I SAM-dependent methyltransferase [Saprospiraceae bacterium]|nr:class I SAM-dependent methyltransferase [Saprospiraceae bacterium]MCB9320269.1 class I SAM-dependent methyltransferase [Lewinellaceae bacterium]